MNVVNVFGNFQDHATLACLIWDSFNQIYGLERSQLPNLVNGLERSTIERIHIEIRQILCKNSIEMLHRELTFGKYIHGLERSQLPNLGNGLERSQSNEYTV